MTRTASLFAEKGHPVTLLVLDHTADSYYPIHPSVKIEQAHLHFGITEKGNTLLRKWWMWKDIRRLRRFLLRLQPHHLICSEYPFAVAAVLAGAGKFCRVYSWEHHHFGAQALNRFWRSLVNRTYPQLDAVICLNKDEQDHYLALNKGATVIPNFTTAPAKSDKTDKEFDLISVTRFNPIKGIDLLMQVAQIVFRFRPELKWKVIGYGEQEEVFLSFIHKEGLYSRLVFQAATKTDLSDDYNNAGILIMTSRNECFPLVLLEAMSHGLPSVAFDCETGPRHIIGHGVTGLLVEKENVNAMASAILQLLNETALRARMKEQSLQKVQQFYPDNVYSIWQDLFSRNS